MPPPLCSLIFTFFHPGKVCLSLSLLLSVIIVWYIQAHVFWLYNRITEYALQKIILQIVQSGRFIYLINIRVQTGDYLAMCILELRI